MDEKKAENVLRELHIKKLNLEIKKMTAELALLSLEERPSLQIEHAISNLNDRVDNIYGMLSKMQDLIINMLENVFMDKFEEHDFTR